MGAHGDTLFRKICMSRWYNFDSEMCWFVKRNHKLRNAQRVGRGTFFCTVQEEGTWKKKSSVCVCCCEHQMKWNGALKVCIAGVLRASCWRNAFLTIMITVSVMRMLTEIWKWQASENNYIHRYVKHTLLQICTHVYVCESICAMLVENL